MAFRRSVGSRTSRGAWAVWAYLAFQACFFFLPLLFLLLMSGRRYQLGMASPGTTASNYLDVVGGASFPRGLGLSLLLAGAVAVLAVVLGVTVVIGAFAARGRRFREGVLLSCVAMFFAGVIPRLYALGFVLSGQGPAARLWRAIGHEAGLLYTRAGVVLAFMSVVLPLAVLALYVARASVDQRFVYAAADLGAGWWETQFRVVLPLMKPGLVVAIVLPFVIAVGDVVVVDLIGGAQVYTGALVITDYVKIDDWGRAAAAGAILLVIVSTVLALADFFIRSWMRRLGGPGHASR